MTEQPLPAPFDYAGHGPNASTGVLLSHGFTGSTVSMLAWARYLADQGYAVSLPLLPGHGTTWQELARTPWQRWYEAYEDAYLRLRERTGQVVAGGLSMGGALAFRLAAHQEVAGVLAVNPGLTAADPRARYAGLLKYVIRSVPAIGNDIARPGQDEGAYARTPVAAVHQLLQLFRDTTASLPSVTAPALVFRSAVDAIVPESSMDALRRGLTATELTVVPLARSYHVATMDHDADLIFEQSHEFIHNVSAGTRA